MSVEERSRVYIYDIDVYGELLSYGVFASFISYKMYGIEHRELFLNDEFEIIHELGIEEIEEELE